MKKRKVLAVNGNLFNVQSATKDKNIMEYILIVLCYLFMV
jgi:hypothetical protein